MCMSFTGRDAGTNGHRRRKNASEPVDGTHAPRSGTVRAGTLRSVAGPAYGRYSRRFGVSPGPGAGG